VLVNDSTGLFGSDSVSFSIVNSVPSVSIVSPVSQEYFYGVDIDLIYDVSDADEDLESCWYNLNEEDISLINCGGSEHCKPC